MTTKQQLKNDILTGLNTTKIKTISARLVAYGFNVHSNFAAQALQELETEEKIVSAGTPKTYQLA